METILITLFIPIIIGAFISLTKYLPETTAKTLNSYIFNVSVPVGIFLVISKVNLNEIGNYSSFIVANFIVMGLGYILMFFIFRKLFKDLSTALSLMIAAGTGNVIFFGIPVITQLLGEESEIYTSFYTVVFFLAVSLVCILVIQIAKTSNFDPKKITKLILKNPVIHANILGIILAIVTAATGFKLPDSILNPLQLISNTTTPLALFAVGFYLAQSFEIKNIKELFSISIAKFLLLPVLAFAIASLFGLVGVPLWVSVLQAMMPTATLALVLTEEYELKSKISGSSIVATSIVFFLLLPLIASVVEGLS